MEDSETKEKVSQTSARTQMRPCAARAARQENQRRLPIGIVDRPIQLMALGKGAKRIVKWQTRGSARVEKALTDLGRENQASRKRLSRKAPFLFTRTSEYFPTM